MWLIVGLGNPGGRYAKTRHNVGFLAVEELAAGQGLAFRDHADYRICNGSIGDVRVVLMEPLTFMNRSGSAVRRVMDRFSIPPEEVVVIHDDLDLSTGIVKIRKKGSSGGHKGVESIIQSVGTNCFKRVKIGIGRDESMPTEDYVLSKFRKDELPLIREAIARAVESVLAILEDGVEKAMNRFN